MVIKRVIIENYKQFYGKFELELQSGTNIIVGDNESGKTSIIEAIELALSGLLNGRFIRFELTQYLFNNRSVDEYLKALLSDNPIAPPQISIELFFDNDNFPIFEGSNNSTNEKAIGFTFYIRFDERYKEDYQDLINSKTMRSLPIEYYEVIWKTFAREDIVPKQIPFKSALIDSSINRYESRSDIYISKILRELLDTDEIIEVAQSYRNMKDNYGEQEIIKKVNERIHEAISVSKKSINIAVDLEDRNAWESSLVTCLDDIPYDYIGKGEQCIVKTNLALIGRKAVNAGIVMIEEPEAHLSYNKLNELIQQVEEKSNNRQLIITTHSSFVANKIGLEKLILLYSKKTLVLSKLDPDTYDFYKKLPGYDTLRLLLCKKAILVEGASDELVVQKAYMTTHSGKLPIEDGIDVISVGLSFLRFLEIAEQIDIPVVVVTDNDGDIEAIKKKYFKYIDSKSNIKICYDKYVDDGPLNVDSNQFNYNTLEPKFIKANGFENTCKILDVKYDEITELQKFMYNNKTDVALKIFNTKLGINFPEYIMDAIK
jgi:putative ATP-dependent endonuclease of OLD family